MWNKKDRLKAKFSQMKSRRLFWEKALQGRVAELIFSGNASQAEDELKLMLKHGVEAEKTGEVYLVGAGPGDPELLTFKALRLMQQADVIVHDRLVSQAVLNLVRRDSEKIYVGKEKSKHTLQQEDINQLLIDLAVSGKRVCRLKGGDPFIFGRGGEEIETLFEHKIPFQVVPGITAASGCSSYAGIPLTHRDYAQSCVFVTGHLKDNSSNLNWPALAQPQQTVVFYMGLTGVQTIRDKLIEHGLPESTPVAIVEKGTTQQQVVHVTTLYGLSTLVKDKQIHPPTLIIVGDVVKLHDQLAWFTVQDKKAITTHQFA